jgi:formylglycine-generating enzyme required for sulfatase activity
MTINCECGNCGKEYRVSNERAGRKFRCRQCDAAVHVPDGYEDEYEVPSSPRRNPASKRRRSGGRGKQTRSKKSKSKTNTSLIVGIGAGSIVLVAGIVVGYFLLTGDSREVSPVVEDQTIKEGNNNGLAQEKGVKRDADEPLTPQDHTAGATTLQEVKPETNHSVNSIGMAFVPFAAGTFTMGSSTIQQARPEHEVTLSQPFQMGIYEVTQEQYQRVMGTNPSKFKGEKNPVEQVRWTDAVAFCEKLSTLPKERATGFQYRLPTEAEWEYACRAGTVTEFSFGDDPAEFSDHAWHRNNSEMKTHPAGEKRPNPAGLYDLHGNVFEWCHDWLGDYSDRAVTNPTGPDSGKLRVIRGGNFSSVVGFHASAIRVADSPMFRDSGVGFRVVRVKKQPK